jgi:hypothetical protein
MLLPLKEVQLTTAPSTTSNEGTDRPGEQGSSECVHICLRYLTDTDTLITIEAYIPEQLKNSSLYRTAHRKELQWIWLNLLFSEHCKNTISSLSCRPFPGPDTKPWMPGASMRFKTCFRVQFQPTGGSVLLYPDTRF